MNILNIEFNTDLDGFTVLTDATTDRINIQFNDCIATTKECNDHIDFTDEQFNEFWIAINLNDTARKLIADYAIKLDC